MTKKTNGGIPVLEEWYMMDNTANTNPRPAVIMTECRFVGEVYGHPNSPDGHTLSTSLFKRFIKEDVIETEKGYKYRLGKMGPYTKTRFPHIEDIFKEQWNTDKEKE